MTKLSAKIVKLFLQKAPSTMFDWVLNTQKIIKWVQYVTSQSFRKTCKDVRQSDQANFKTPEKTFSKKNIWAKSTEQYERWHLNSDIIHKIYPSFTMNSISSLQVIRVSLTSVPIQQRIVA